MESLKLEVPSITRVYSNPRILMGSTSMDSNNPDWHLLIGSGSRTSTQLIDFPESFKEKPDVKVFLAGFDIDQGHNARLTISVDKISRDNFVIRYNTWADSMIYMATISWIAIGES